MPARLHALALALVIAAGGLVVDPAGWSPFGPAKWLAVVVTASAGVALAVGGRPLLRLPRRALAAWAAFLGWVIVAAAAGLDPRLAWFGTPQRHFGALTWMLCGGMWVAGHTLDDPRDARFVAGTAAAVGGLIGAWSLAELAGWQPVPVATGGRLVGPLGSAAYLGAAEALLIPIAAGLAADRSARPAARGLAGGCAALGVVALVGSGARAAWCGVIIAGAALAWIHRKKWGAWRHRRRILPVFVAATAAVAGVVGLAVVTGTAARVPNAFDGAGPGGLSRLAEWRVASRVLWSHPWTGVGPEGYRIAFGSAVDAAYQRRYGRNPLPDRAHDSLLDVAVTTGIPGVLAYVALLGLAGAFALRAMRRGPPRLAGIGAGLVAYTGGALWLFPMAEIEPAVWLLAGLVSASMASAAETVEVRLPEAARLAAAVGVAGSAGVVAVIGARAVAADQILRSALTAPVSAGRADRAVALAPGDIVVRLTAAEVDAASGTLPGVDRAVGQVDAGLRISPRDPVLAGERAGLLVQRAQLTGAQGDWRAAAADLSGLVARDPLDPALLLQQGVADAALGRTGDAEVALAAAASLDPGSGVPQTDLALLYQQEGRDGAARAAAVAALSRDPADVAAATVLSELGGRHGT